jgi:dTDP-4-amino-4,6-dideoxygalactose transaminase
MVGSFGDLSCFSFYPTKNIGAIGEAGAVATRNTTFLQNIRERRNLGCSTNDRYNYHLLGTNARLDELQAGFINAKLPYLRDFINQKQILAKLYETCLSKSRLVQRLIRSTKQEVSHSCHLMVFIVKYSLRDELLKYLNKNKIEALIHYPISFHQCGAMTEANAKIRGETKNSEFLAANIISLPLYHTLESTEVEKICSKILEFEAKLKFLF